MFHFSQQRQTTHLKRNLYNLLGAFDELRQMTCRGAYRRARSTLSGSSALPIMQMNRMSPRPPAAGGGGASSLRPALSVRRLRCLRAGQMSCNMIMKKLLSVFQTITKRERGLRLIMMNCNKANVLMSVALCSRKSGWPARKREEKEMIGQSAAASPAGAGSVQAVRTQDIYMPEQYHLQSFLWS